MLEAPCCLGLSGPCWGDLGDVGCSTRKRTISDWQLLIGNVIVWGIGPEKLVRGVLPDHDA